MNFDKWFYTCLALIGLVFAGLLMVFKYFLKIDRNSIELRRADKQHELKIKELEDKTCSTCLQQESNNNKLEQKIQTLEKKYERQKK